MRVIDEAKFKERQKFYSEYAENHKVCPKCGSLNCMQTLMGGSSELDENYQNTNRSRCEDCGDVHIVHDRERKK